MSEVFSGLRTDIGSSTPDSITIFGRDFVSEILGHLSFGDMAFLELTMRECRHRTSRRCSTRCW